MLLIVTLAAAIVLLVLDINNVIHMSYWAIAAIGFSPIALSIVLLLFGGLLVGIATAIGGRK